MDYKKKTFLKKYLGITEYITINLIEKSSNVDL